MKTVIPGVAVVAAQGVSPGGANSEACVEVDDVRVTFLEAAKTKGERGKVYVMLGANALDLALEPFIGGYRDFVASLKQQYPKAVIYIQSMLPVTEGVNKTYPNKNINNERITEYNAAIREMAKETGVFYLDVSQCMENERGFLPENASPFDGMHLNPEYYMKWFDYLRAHTITNK
jgi:lysophospholipase L1-like esterase